MEWQPIETAPKDDREVFDTPTPREFAVLLAFRAEDAGGGCTNPGVCIAYWDAYYAPGGGGYYEGCSPWVVADCGETTTLHYTGPPTHWMPLPEPPVEK